jgi:hypothetical protein
MLIDDHPEAGASRRQGEGQTYDRYYEGWNEDGVFLMRWRSWRGADKSAETAKEHIHAASQEVAAVIQPTSALVMGIVSASWGCTQTLKTHLRPSKEMVRYPEVQQAYIFFEFMSFFLYLMGVFAFNLKLPPQRYLKLKEVVLLMIVAPQVETFFGDWPDKTQIRDQLHKVLESADATFGQAGDQSWERLTANVLRVAGYEIENQSSDVEAAAVRELITTGLGKALTDLNADKFEGLVKTASAAIEIYERDGSSLPELLRRHQSEANP